VGGYSDWLRQRPAAPAAVPAPAAKSTSATAPAPAPAPAPAKRKLSFKDQRELEQLPARIERLENEIGERTAAMNEPSFFQQDSAAIVQANETLAALQAELDAAYARWSELEG
jgi:ATP-binding cassette subfamily F protein uup